MPLSVSFRRLFRAQCYPEPLRLLWKLHSLDLRFASIRYRALIPIQALSTHGYQSTIGRSIGNDKLDAADAVIFVRPYSSEDLNLAQKAKDIGIPIVLDICDNPDEYTPNQFGIIQTMARYAAVITTNGPVLSNLLCDSLKMPVPVMVVSDGIETETMLRIGHRIIRRAYFDEVLLPMLMSAKFYRTVIPKILSKVVAHGIQLQAQMIRAFGRPIPNRLSIGADRTNLRSMTRLNNDSSKTLIWFGRSGGASGKYGLSDIVDVAPCLKQLNGRIRIKLVVVSNDREGYQHLVQPLPIQTEYIEWDNESIRSHIQASNVAIIPNSRDPIAICKSANRAVLALSLGVPVVASRTPAMEILEGCVCFDDWIDSLYRYLTEPSLVHDHLLKAQSVLRREFDSDRIARQWQEVLKRIKSPTPLAGENSGNGAAHGGTS
jgi:glycosyltransferase involved in cell wall biosynthesis